MAEKTEDLGAELIASMDEALAHARGEDNGTRVSHVVRLPVPHSRDPQGGDLSEN